MSEEKKECRICFDGEIDGDSLISPCKCKGTSAFIHKSCLNNWRQFNIGREPWTKCMECHAKYIISRKYPFENFLYKQISKLPILYFGESTIGFSGALLIWCIEYNTDYLAIKMLNFGNNPKYDYIIEDIRNDEFLPQMFYYCYTFFLQSIFFHIFFLYNVYYHIKTKNIYFEKIKPLFYCSILFCFNFLYLYYCLVWNKLSILFYNFGVFFTFITPYFHYKLLKNHNKIIRIMNIENEEQILSFSFNPLNEEKMVEMVNVIIE